MAIENKNDKNRKFCIFNFDFFYIVMRLNSRIIRPELSFIATDLTKLAGKKCS